MTRTWMNTACLDLMPWPHRLCIAIELDPHTLLYITEGGHTHVMCFDDEEIHMPYSWKLLGD